jgi:hypothetical protein
LQAELGDLAEVEITPKHPRLEQIDTLGLERALKSWETLSPLKSHFLLLSFVNGVYELEARQYDGLTGLASPVVRRAQTADRQLVARTAALLINEDFGLVGSIRKVDGDKVEIALKGGRLGVPLDHWLKKGDVFAIAKIVRQPGGSSRSERVEWADLLVGEPPKGGMCICQLFHRRPDPLPSGPGILGYRCLKLGTIEGPVRLRLVSGDKLVTPASSLQVRVSAQGFQPNNAERISSDSEGLVTTQRRYHNLAFVMIYSSDEPVAKLPVEIVDDRPVVIDVNVQKDADQRGQLNRRRDRWTLRALDSWGVANALFKGINEKKEAPKEELLASADAALKRLQSDIAALSGEAEELRVDARSVPGGLDLADGDKTIEDLKGQRDYLQDYIGKVKELMAKEADPARQKWKDRAQQASLLENDLEIGRAIELYEEVLKQGGNDPKLRTHLDDLKKGWALKGEDHAKARAFVYETWPKADSLSNLKADLPRAHEAFAACRAVGDHFTVQKLQRVSVAHRARILKEVDSLNPQEREDDRKRLETILALDEELKKLIQDLSSYLGGGKSKT